MENFYFGTCIGLTLGISFVLLVYRVTSSAAFEKKVLSWAAKIEKMDKDKQCILCSCSLLWEEVCRGGRDPIWYLECPKCYTKYFYKKLDGILRDMDGEPTDKVNAELREQVSHE